jgi:BMFP domain-containing protein YqiC
MPNLSILEDLLALADDALNHLADARHDLKAHAKGRAEDMARKLNLVGRAEFDAAFAMLAKARNAQEDLATRLSKIESILNLSSHKKTVKTKKSNLRIVKTKKKKHARR